MTVTLNFKIPCLVVQSTNLISTYNNGASGVGATLTNIGPFINLKIDGVDVPINARVLVIGQSSTYENGVYICTTQGSLFTAWVLTRSTDYDMPSQIKPFDVFPIIDGMEFIGSDFLQYAIVNTIGTEPILFYSYRPSSNVVLPLNIEFSEWASQIRVDLTTIDFPLPFPVEHWRNWASQVVNSNNLSNVPLPTDICYPNNEDWRKWGAYFINNVYN